MKYIHIDGGILSKSKPNPSWSQCWLVAPSMFEENFARTDCPPVFRDFLASLKTRLALFFSPKKKVL